jgi:hypothetical protein
MALWATRSDLESAIGDRDLIALADLDNEGSESASTEARIAAAIAAADESVKALLRGRIDVDEIAYADAPANLRRYVVKLSVVELQSLGRRGSYTETEEKLRASIFAELRDYAKGMAAISYMPTEQEGALRDQVVMTTVIGSEGTLAQLMEDY